MKKIINKDFNPNFTNCPNQYSSPANDLRNSERAMIAQRSFYGQDPDGVMFDKAGNMWTKKAAQRPDEIINEANGE